MKQYSPRTSIEQELSTEKYITIPEEVRLATPGLAGRARYKGLFALEAVLNTPAKIYFKREDLSPTGSHKPNSAIPQAYYNMKAGHRESYHRDRCRTMGIFARTFLRSLQLQVHGLYGQG